MLRITLIAVFALIAQINFASIDKIEAFFNSGKITELTTLIDTIDTTDENVIACKSFYKAKLKDDPKETKRLLKDISKYFEKTDYGQKSLLELGIIDFLLREYDSSISSLNKIKSENIHEKYFWLAKNNFSKGKFSEAIRYCQTFIQKSSDNVKIEVAYLIIANSYETQNKWKFAINTLETLKKSNYAKNQKPMIDFKLGLYYKNIGNYNKTIVIYQNLIQSYPYHQLAFSAEEALYSLEKTQKIEIDMNAVLAHNENVEIDAKNEIIPSESIKEEPKPKTNELKIYLQTGAFSTQTNAKKLQKKIFTLGYESIIFPKISSGKELQVVAAGPFNDKSNARSAQQKLKEKKINSFIIKRY